jgi:citronellol/citronellal dehydrogenase
VAHAVERFGGIDILVNNASAISLTGTAATPMRRFDLMMSINTRGTYLCSQKCLPHLRKAANPHILTLSPPLDMRAKWFAPHVAYTMAKYGMSMCVLGMAEELRADGIAVNALWPKTIIATAALQLIEGVKLENGRKPEIVADAAHWILTRPSREATGRFFTDEEALRDAGVSDFAAYAHTPGARLLPDLFVD